MNNQDTRTRIAVLSCEGIEQRSRILKELDYLRQTYVHVDSFSLRRRGLPDLTPNLVQSVRFRTATPSFSKTGAQALMAGIPPLRKGGPPVVTLRAVQAATCVLTLLIAVLATGALGWSWSTFGVVGTLLLFSSALWFYLRDRYRVVGAQTELSPKTNALVPIADERASQFKRSYVLGAMVEDAIAEEGPYDILHAHDLIALEAGVRIKQRHGGKLIWDAHEIYEDVPEPDPALSALARRTIREATPHIDGILTVTEGLAAHYREVHSALPPAEVVMNAAPLATTIVDDGRLRDALGIDPEKRILLYQGGMTVQRGLTILMDAIELLPETWLLAMIGDGPLRPELEARATAQADRTGSQRTRLLPAVANAELASWTAGATLGVMPYENTSKNTLNCGPNKLWEFPAAGVPFIAPRLLEVEKIVDRYGTGFLMDLDFTAETIADLVGSLTEADFARARQNGVKFLEEMSWEHFAPRIGRLYESVTRQNRPARAPHLQEV